MKIACLQFAPLVGDKNNNLNRADAVLNKAVDVENLDLLVLPEMAFSGYNFRSLAHITPYFEPTASGITSLWARTTALKFGCNVIVGYPEKVDVRNNWPANPEFYNSAVFIGRDGETIGNYRKTFLYAVDEKWALEGPDGFFDDELGDLGSVALGICMDLNPYRFEAPWDAFEFANHVLDVRANLVVLSMAWLTTEDPETFSQFPNQPDMFTLDYWIQRLEPVITSTVNRYRHNSTGQAPVGRNDEIIVVICNRCGNEDEALYAGTTAVVGLQNGEVKLYGILGRGVKELLVVDTDKEPYAKIIQTTRGTNEAEAREEPAHQQNSSPSTAQPPNQSSTFSGPFLDPGQQTGGGGVGPSTGNASSLNPTIGRTPTSPTSMVAFPPSRPSSAVNGGSENANGQLGRTRFLDNAHLNVNRNSIEFVSPLSTEASWKHWERSAAERLTSLNDPIIGANTNRNRNRHDELPTPVVGPYNPGLPKPRQNTAEAQPLGRNSPGAFRDAVGSPTSDDSSEDARPFQAFHAFEPPNAFETFEAFQPAAIKAAKKPTNKAASNTAASNTAASNTANQGATPKADRVDRADRTEREDREEKGRLSRQEEKYKEAEKKVERWSQKMDKSTPVKKVFSPSFDQPAHSRLSQQKQASSKSKSNGHTDKSTPILINMNTAPDNNDDSILIDFGMQRSSSAQSWDSMTGNSVTSLESRHSATFAQSAHPAFGNGAEDFDRFLASSANDKQHQGHGHGHARAQSYDEANLGHMHAAHHSHNPEDFYRTMSSNTEATNSRESAQQSSGGEQVYFLSDDIVDDLVDGFEDEFEDGFESDPEVDNLEEEYTNNPAVMSELMQLLQPHRTKAEERLKGQGQGQDQSQLGQRTPNQHTPSRHTPSRHTPSWHMHEAQHTHRPQALQTKSKRGRQSSTAQASTPSVSTPNITSPRSRTPKRPGSTKSRNASRPRASDRRANTTAPQLFRPSSSTRLSHSASQPQIRDSRSPARAPAQVQAQTQLSRVSSRQSSQTQSQNQVKDISRSSSVQNNTDVALYFRPDKSSRSHSRNAHQAAQQAEKEARDAKEAKKLRESHQRRESASREGLGSRPSSGAQVYTGMHIATAPSNNIPGLAKAKPLPKLSTSIAAATGAQIHTATPIVSTSANNPFSERRTKYKPALTASKSAAATPTTSHTPLSAHPTSRVSMQDSQHSQHSQNSDDLRDSTEFGELSPLRLPDTPMSGITSAWPTGRSGSRHTHRHSKDTGKKRSSSKDHSRSSSGKLTPQMAPQIVPLGPQIAPQSAVNASSLFYGSTKSGMASPQGIATAPPLGRHSHERATSAMSFLSGTSLATSSYTATESWLATTPAPPAIYEQQQLQRQEALQRMERRRMKQQHEPQLEPQRESEPDFESDFQPDVQSGFSLEPESAQRLHNSQQLQQAQNGLLPRSASVADPMFARGMDPDDEIIAMINLVHKGRPMHRKGQQQRPSFGAGSAPPTSLDNQNQTRPTRRLASPTEEARYAKPDIISPGFTNYADGEDNADSEYGHEYADSRDGSMDESIYEVILPPHIRELVDSMKNPLEKSSAARIQRLVHTARSNNNLAKGASIDAQLSRGTPRFNPPTPRAMQFTAEDSVSEIRPAEARKPPGSRQAVGA
ncbi:carbon-nitrogen hydrolase [Ophiostoma piceae UAMH 11346]|uniref:Carbon-nitrogen hydrolase n=1 Tax=Ophiostoma piceae (strain UAMH 11346) TaxID=1262450 RepID=S3BR64_OPHP1|nr:carbon-nitrogen hydrolase [Ophiostoma piceae UAMH 11346]